MIVVLFHIWPSFILPEMIASQSRTDFERTTSFSVIDECFLCVGRNFAASSPIIVSVFIPFSQGIQQDLIKVMTNHMTITTIPVKCRGTHLRYFVHSGIPVDAASESYVCSHYRRYGFVELRSKPRFTSACADSSYKYCDFSHIKLCSNMLLMRAWRIVSDPL